MRPKPLPGLVLCIGGPQGCHSPAGHRVVWQVLRCWPDHPPAGVCGSFPCHPCHCRVRVDDEPPGS
eukprot:13652136-Alexandrium_andersonii.AAC.1